LKNVGTSNLKIARFMDAKEEDIEHVSHTVQFRVLCPEYGDIVVTAQTVPKICPPPSFKIVDLYKQ